MPTQDMVVCRGSWVLGSACGCCVRCADEAMTLIPKLIEENKQFSGMIKPAASDDHDYSNEPVSITELRANRGSSPKKWTPRDVLINILRDIDSGAEAYDTLITFARLKDGDGFHRKGERYWISSPDYHITLGLVYSILSLLTTDADEDDDKGDTA